MISRAFNGQHGRAYLFDGVVNVIEGEPNDRQMTTGNHTVRDIYCVKCGQTLGWKYDRAYEQSQRYKEASHIPHRCTAVNGCLSHTGLGILAHSPFPSSTLSPRSN
ncbi:unnamed protein product [Somion occarium]|uniref:Protein yippee-like n=1 Tax=Somion occarium TaxID=3059160 RepID=A0ABP1CL96_9APHY